MDLWIKSQDNNKIRKIMLKVHTIELGDYNKNYCIVANNLYNVGIYKSKKRASEIFDDIQNFMFPILETEGSYQNNDLFMKKEIVRELGCVYIMPKE